MAHSHGAATTDANGTVMSSMIPWLHFDTGDNLFFSSWHPNTPGALVGASIGLIFLALFERWIAAIRGTMEAHWKRHALALMSSKDTKDTSTSDDGACCTSEKDKDTEVEEVDVNRLPSQSAASRSRASRSPRVIPPFIPSHDFTRGILFAFQALLQYLLMLAIMTFQAAYFISIVGGLGIGEMLFGRMGSAHVH